MRYHGLVGRSRPINGDSISAVVAPCATPPVSCDELSNSRGRNGETIPIGMDETIDDMAAYICSSADAVAALATMVETITNRVHSINSCAAAYLADHVSGSGA